MTKIILLFIRAKAWQLFILIFVLPFGAQFVLTETITKVLPPEPLPPEEFLTSIKSSIQILNIFIVFFMSIFLGWFWSVGTFCHRLIREEIRPSKKLFNFSILYPFGYTFLFMAYFYSAVTGTKNSISFSFISPLHLLAALCMFYNLYYVAKNLIMVEKQEPVIFRDYASSFYLIWFYPVGIWFIQPKVNALSPASDS